MAKDYKITVKCPHCALEQNFILSPPNRFGHGYVVVRCWNAELQQGCQKEMTLNTEIRIWTDATPDQKAQHERSLASAGESPADKMGESV